MADLDLDALEELMKVTLHMIMVLARGEVEESRRERREEQQQTQQEVQKQR